MACKKKNALRYFLELVNEWQGEGPTCSDAVDCRQQRSLERPWPPFRASGEELLVKGEMNIRLCFNNTSIKNRKWTEDHVSVRGELTSWHFSLWRGRWATVTGAENGYGASSQWCQPHWDEGLGPIKRWLHLPDGRRVRQLWDLWSENRCKSFPYENNILTEIEKDERWKMTGEHEISIFTGGET